MGLLLAVEHAETTVELLGAFNSCAEACILRMEAGNLRAMYTALAAEYERVNSQLELAAGYQSALRRQGGVL